MHQMGGEAISLHLKRDQTRLPPFFLHISALCRNIGRIRRNKAIEGISIKGNKIKISQHEWLGMNMNLLRPLCMIETVYHALSSVLKLNNKKTEVFWIGSYTGRENQFSSERNLKWDKDKVKSFN